MNDDKYSKRRLFGSLSWLIIGVYIAANIAIINTMMPFSTLVVVLPIINVVLIVAWFIVRSFFNIANDPIKHSEYLNSKATVRPPDKYGNENRSEYIPNVKVRTELFNSINTEPNNKALFDITLKDYLKLERIIVFHDENNYGALKEVKVAKVTMREVDIEVSFSPAV